MSFHRIKLKLLLIKLLFLHFGRYLQIGTMDFRTAYMIRKHLDGILFSDIIVEALRPVWRNMTFFPSELDICFRKTAPAYRARPP